MLSWFLHLWLQVFLSLCMLSCLLKFTFISFVRHIYTKCIQCVEVYANVWNVHEWFSGLGCHGNMFVEYMRITMDVCRPHLAILVENEFSRVKFNIYSIIDSSYLFSTISSIAVNERGALLWQLDTAIWQWIVWSNICTWVKWAPFNNLQAWGSWPVFAVDALEIFCMWAWLHSAHAWPNNCT